MLTVLNNENELGRRGVIVCDILTITKVQVDTAEELNGKTYFLQEQTTVGGEPSAIRFRPGIDATYAQAHHFTFQMERQIVNQQNVEELITVSGSFTAKKIN